MLLICQPSVSVESCLTRDGRAGRWNCVAILVLMGLGSFDNGFSSLFVLLEPL